MIYVGRACTLKVKQMETKLIFIILSAVLIIGNTLKFVFVKKNQIVGSYHNNSKIVPWSYSRQQGRWVSPDKPFSPSEMNGNVYLGKEEIDTTWENYNKKE
jgi:hypothetical protein